MVPGLRLSPLPPSASRLPRTWRKLTASARKATRAGAPGSPLAARNRSDSRRPGSRAAAVMGYPPARSRAGIRLEPRRTAFLPCASVLGWEGGACGLAQAPGKARRGHGAAAGTWGRFAHWCLCADRGLCSRAGVLGRHPPVP